MSQELDIGPLSWVKDEIDRLLGDALVKSAEFAASPADPSPLRFCQTHVHQVTGALSMVGVEGAQRFSEEIERYAAALEKKSKQPQPLSADDTETLAAALSAMRGYIQSLAEGEPDVPLRLFPEYKAMRIAQGVEHVQESELFFPDLFNSAPAGLETYVPEGKGLPVYLNEQGQEYRKLLVQWLHTPGDKKSLAGMRDVLEAVERAQSLPAQKTLWWVAAGLMDAIARNVEQLSQSCRHVLMHLERQIHYLVQGHAKPSNNLLRDMLYYVAISAPVTDRLREVQQIFDLEKYRQPDAEEHAAEAAASGGITIEAIQTAIAALKECWMQVSAGQPDRRAIFMDQSRTLADKVGDGKPQLKRVLLDIAGSAQVLAALGKTPDPVLAIEMATTLLMLESALEASGKARSKALKAVAAQSAAMRALLPSEDAVPAVAQPEAAAEDTNLIVLAKVADEIRANFLRVERTLDEFFRDTNTRGQLSELMPLLQQVAGAFRMLEQPVAAEVIDGANAMVARFAQPTTKMTHEESELVAESLGALSFYLDRLLQGDSEAIRAIAPLPERLQAALNQAVTTIPAPLTPQVVVPVVPETLVDRALDEELLEVYLTEVGEVYETIVECVQRLREHPDDHEALVTVRRAFHTLKGSGRTVGLTAMGEVAWSVEQLLNHLIEQRADNKELPVPAPVLSFVDDAGEQFQDWVSQLLTRGEVALTPGTWKLRADALLANPDAPAEIAIAEPTAPAPAAAAPVAAPVVEAPAAPVEKPAETDVVVIGGTHRINRDLFGIFMGEARTNLGRLQQMLSAAQHHAEPPIPDIERPAHTLAGVSRTVGIMEMSALAKALEIWLGKVRSRFSNLSQEELHLFDQTVVALQSMLQKVENQRLPEAAPWLCDTLNPPDGVTPQAVTQQPQQPPQPAQPVTQVVVEADIAPKVAPQAPIPTQQPAAQTPPPQPVSQAPAYVPVEDTDHIDQQLLELFLEESGELMLLAGRQLRDWQAKPEDAQPQQALQRALHTLKGSARMAGAMRIGENLHNLETRVEEALSEGAPTAANFAAFFSQYDTISEQLDELRRYAEMPTEIALVPSVADEVMPETQAQLQPQQHQPQQAQPLASEGLTVTPTMRVRPETIDYLVNEAGEVSIARSRIERQMETFKSSLQELTDSVNRLRGQLREVEIEAETQMQSRLSQLQEAHETFDPLEFDRYTRFQELTRMMAESVHDVATVQQGLMGSLNETDAALNEQSRMTRQLQQGLMRTRMVRFDTISERLHRIVRQTSGELQKPADLDIQGEAVEIDRSVLEKMIGPMEHLLRNAIAHGLEDAEKRAAAKKPETGHISIQARQEGNEIILSLSDDGAGLDFNKIRNKARALNLLNDAQLNDPAELVSIIFESGFSTSENLTQVSGRGIGLDAVRTDITGLGGRVEVASDPGQGSVFTIYLPLTLAVNQTVLISVGGEEYLLPAQMVEQVQNIRQNELAAVEESGQFLWGGWQHTLHRLSRLLGKPAAHHEAQAYTPVMLLRSGKRRIALIVDEILGNREIVVKNIGPQLAGMGSVSGATVMGDGKVMLILNPIHMAFREVLIAAETAAAVPEPVVEAPTQPIIMVVDDSLTMRKVISRLLTREGYQAVTAKDGVDALQQLETVKPEVILLDIEMPRMDGFELARAVRGNPKTARIPMIVISSRTADKHRAYAQELGVNVYLGKPYQEEELLKNVAEFVAAKKS
ncbi:MAG: Hpt domain-containing protein [Methylobacillus sp.]|nr:Hpt domain-containing protein [Methylobacillus sp.]